MIWVNWGSLLEGGCELTSNYGELESAQHGVWIEIGHCGGVVGAYHMHSISYFTEDDARRAI